MKKLTITIIALLVLLQSAILLPAAAGTASASGTSTSDLILTINSDQMEQDGQFYTAAQPMTAKKGISYVAVRSLGDRMGLNITYDSSAKALVIRSGDKEVRYTIGSSKYTVNGVSTAMKGAAYQQNYVFMVPLTSIVQALDIPYSVNQAKKTVTLQLSTLPVASFTISPGDIYAGQTSVTYTAKSSSPRGYAIVAERWIGQSTLFEQAGTYTVSYQVQDETGQWSDPYSMTLDVLPRNEPPVADFITDKTSYKMGELITISDRSSDDYNAIAGESWINNELAFFEPGPVTITLMVTDDLGQTDTHRETITITDEQMYTEAEFYQLYTPVGAKYKLNGGNVPSMEKMSTTVSDEDVTLIRSNNPETVYNEGIVYEETSSGATRVMVHHLNATGKKVKMYVIATNVNASTATMQIQDSGFAGPSLSATGVGKASLIRYFQSIQSGADAKQITFAPGESKIVFTDLNKVALASNTVISLLTDVNTDLPIKFQVIMIEETKDPLAVLDTLEKLPTDPVHNRGTYRMANRTINVDEPIGSVASRLLLGDNVQDINLTGRDGITGQETSNAGNFGVLYTINLNRVAPNTLISFNPRGGAYTGYVIVNGTIVDITSGGSLTTSNEAGVLHRTGFAESTVQIVFMASPGSNLAVNLIAAPLPR